MADRDQIQLQFITVNVIIFAPQLPAVKKKKKTPKEIPSGLSIPVWYLGGGVIVLSAKNERLLALLGKTHVLEQSRFPAHGSPGGKGSLFLFSFINAKTVTLHESESAHCNWSWLLLCVLQGLDKLASLPQEAWCISAPWGDFFFKVILLALPLSLSSSFLAHGRRLLPLYFSKSCLAGFQRSWRCYKGGGRGKLGFFTT